MRRTAWSSVPIENIEAYLTMFLVGGCILVLYNSFNSGLLIFSPSQVDFLFPLPIPRRTVLLSACALALDAAATPVIERASFPTSDGVRLSYLHAERPGARPIVFVPGWCLPADIWQRQLEFFARTHAVYALDQRVPPPRERQVEQQQPHHAPQLATEPPRRPAEHRSCG